MKDILQKVMDRKNLTQVESRDVFDGIMSGNATPSQIAAFIVALRMKGETPEEIAGGAESMRKHAVKINAGAGPVVDTCGTGGDGAHTFNISTLTAFVVAGAGVTVAKHGNRAISSKCGSADLLAALGVNLEATQDVLERSLRENRVAFLFAPKMHPAMKHAMVPRKELGVRTVFNLLGPLTNPAAAPAQVLGVFSPSLTEPLAEVLRLLGSSRAWVVHGADGLDEVTTTALTRVSELYQGRVKTYDFDPRPYIASFATISDLAGGDATVNAEIARKVLAGDKGPRRDIVCLNAAVALLVAGVVADVAEGMNKAQSSIDTGAAKRALDGLVKVSNV